MKALIAVLVIALAAGIALQSMRVSKLKAQNESLRQQVAALQAQADHLSSQPSTPAASATTDEDRSELLRLRNQAAQLKQVTNELQRLRTQVQQRQAASQARFAQVPAAPAADSNAPAGATGPVPRESWAFAGYATPEATLQSAVFAMSQGDYQTFLASMSPEEAARMQKSFEGKTPEQIAEDGRRQTANAKSFQILGKQELSPDRVVLNVYVAGGEDRMQRVVMQKVGDEWKWAGNAGRRQQQQEQQPPPAPAPQ
jgi:hypothetical protein